MTKKPEETHANAHDRAQTLISLAATNLQIALMSFLGSARLSPAGFPEQTARAAELQL